MDKKRRLIIIAGSTATGKTECGIDLALSSHGNIVNCDSRQVYKYMDIGTAKPDLQQRSAVKHYMIDVVEPSDPYNVAKYVEMADKSIDTIYDANSIPFIIGGTGLYIKALLHGLAPIPYIDELVRNNIREQQRSYGNEALYERLKQVDPVDAVHIRKNDSYRLIRALEVFTATGKPLHEYMDQHRFSQTRYKYVYIVLHDSDKQRYHNTIDRRVDLMIEQGLVDEVKWLISKGYDINLPAMKTVGYTEIAEYLNKNIGLDAAIELIKKHTKAYAKRQVTWFKGIKDAIWIDVTDRKNIINDLIKEVIYA